jgi:hypothetical protein
MKYAVECKIDGKLQVNKRVEITKEDKKYIFSPNDKGWLSTITIISDVKHPEKFNTQMKPDNNKEKWILSIAGDKELRLELIHEMQQIESLLSFNTLGSLKSIKWDDPYDRYIPENDDEKRQIQVLAFNLRREHIEHPYIVEENKLREMLDTKDRYSSIIVPQSFFRQGYNDFNSKRYINAFYNFYFILEDIYGKGKTRNKDIEYAFSISTEFRAIVDWMLKGLEEDKEHKCKLKEFCKEEGVEYNAIGVIELLRKVRGHLHHYSRRSTKHLGTPFNQEEFECIAYFALGLSSNAIGQQVVKINHQNS